LNAEGKPYQYVAIRSNITERKQAEEALQQSEQRFRSLVEATSQIVWTNSPKGQMCGVQLSWAKFTGQSEAEYQGYGWAKAVHPDDQQPTIDAWQQAVVTRSMFVFEHRLRRYDGVWRTFSIRGIPVLDADGTTIREWVGVHTDITEHKQAESALRESEERFRGTFNQAAVGIAHVGIEGKWLLVNQKLCDIVGYTREELLTRTFQDITHPDDLDAGLEYVRRVLTNEIQTYSMEKRYIHKNGSFVWTNLTVSLIHEPRYFIAVVEDITERKQAEEALRQSEEFSRRIIESTQDCIKVLDLEGQLLSMNVVGQKLMEISDITLLLKTPWLKLWQGQDQEPRAAMEAARAGGVGKFVGFCPTRTGTPKWWDVVVTPILDAAGRPERLLSVARDITERKQAEERIEAALQEKEVFLKEIHHRVKNNLQIISSLLNLQSRSIQDKQHLEILKDSQSRVRAMALIHEKLYQAKDLARINFAGYIRDLAANLFRSYKGKSDIITLKSNIDNVLVGIDAAVPCGLIINELVSNALKHAFPTDKKGEICISLSSNPDRKLVLVVSDNGVGLPTDLDFQNTTSLGLQLVSTLTAQLRGTVELNSNGGTEFKITFSN